jgi:hypothetical protein
MLRSHFDLTGVDKEEMGILTKQGILLLLLVSSEWQNQRICCALEVLLRGDRN